MAPRDSSTSRPPPTHRRRESDDTRHRRRSTHRSSSRRPPTTSSAEEARAERRSRGNSVSAESPRAAAPAHRESRERRRDRSSRDIDHDEERRRRRRESRDAHHGHDEDRRRRRESRDAETEEERRERREERRQRRQMEERQRREEEEFREAERRYNEYNSEQHGYQDSPRRTRRPAVAAAAAYREDFSDPDDEKPPRRLHKGSNDKNRRVVSGAALEEGQGWRLGGFLGRLRGGGGSSVSSYDKTKDKDESDYTPPRRPVRKKKKIWIVLGILLVLAIIIIVVAVVVSRNNANSGDDDDGDGPDNMDLDDQDRNQIPMKWRGTYLDPFSWDDTEGFNLTFTEETVGDLPLMGLYTEWDDSARANSKVPPLDESWGSYSKKPVRGVNVGGWLNLEPFITPSLFDYDSRYGIVDEYTLCQHLGKRKTAEVLENHYATFVTEQTFKEIRDAGLDHVRIPFGYWAVETYEGDPYLARTSWRYLLRGIEWARKYGLRVKLDPHGIPGSQNGWNHSGRLGAIGWMNGTDGETNRQRSIDFHDRLSKFFAQDRYTNIISFYGLANEPKMTELETSSVVQWNEDVYKLVRENGIKAPVVFGDGFMGLHNWQGVMTGYDDMVLDVHQYVIFNKDQIALSHQDKVEFACDGWTKQTQESMDRSTGYGPTMFAEWSQADTDCAKHLTNVGWGNRWTGTYRSGSSETDVLEPRCPTLNDQCDCGPANAAVDDMSGDYKKFLKMFAQGQMHSFEKGWGWFYWTWDTEDAPLWSYKKALAGGLMPEKPWDRDFDCDGDVPSFSNLPEFYRG